MIHTTNDTITVTIRKVNYTVPVAAVKEMREWASDCTWVEDSYGDDDWMDEMSDIQIIRSVHRNYDGGINSFLRSL
jgi:hypothetical protein